MKTKKFYYAPIVESLTLTASDHLMGPLGPSGPQTTPDPFDGD